MKAPKVIIIGSLALFLGIGATALLKKKETTDTDKGLDRILTQDVAAVDVIHEDPALQENPSDSINRIDRLFLTSSYQLPIVETVSYKSFVPWLKGRPAWVTDYAAHYKTSRHFIARSLNKKRDYLTQKIANGDRFAVFRTDVNLQFYLLADLSACKISLYYLDLDKDERVLLKTYPIGLGAMALDTLSGSLTPIGKYKLGEKTAVYKPGVTGYFQDEQTEMIQVFGTRWIPFGEEIGECSDGYQGFGIHGAPWDYNEESDSLVEDRASVGRYDSDGCIRLLQEDMEELFAIVVSKPTVIEIVKDRRDITLPCNESNEFKEY